MDKISTVIAAWLFPNACQQVGEQKQSGARAAQHHFDGSPAPAARPPVTAGLKQPGQAAGPCWSPGTHGMRAQAMLFPSGSP